MSCERERIEEKNSKFVERYSRSGPAKDMLGALSTVVQHVSSFEPPLTPSQAQHLCAYLSREVREETQRERKSCQAVVQKAIDDIRVILDHTVMTSQRVVYVGAIDMLKEIKGVMGRDDKSIENYRKDASNGNK